MRIITYLVLAIVLNCASNLLAAVDVQQTGNVVVLANEKVSLKLDLERRRLAVTNVVTKEVMLDNASMAADGWGWIAGPASRMAGKVGRLARRRRVCRMLSAKAGV